MARLILSLCAALLLAAAQLPAADLLIGRAAVKITPPPGMPMGGGFTIRPSTAIHDDLYCKTIFLKQADQKTAIVSCDVESLHRPTIDAARRFINQTGAIRGDQVMITATHSHSGPEMTPLVLEGAQGEAARIATSYHNELPRKIAESVQIAAGALTPARVSAGTTRETTVSFNRRYLMNDGSVRTNPGVRNPAIVRPAGPIDPDLHIAYFASPEGQPLATLVNFALHTTSWGGQDFSSDYPGILATLLAAAKDPGMLTMFLQGCSGNINQVDVTSKEKQFGAAKATQIATVLAADVIKAYPALNLLSADRLAVRSQYVPLPVPTYTPADVKQAHEVIAASRLNTKGPKFLDIVDAFRVVNVAERHQGQPINAEVQVIALGDELAWVGLPGEVFTELGMAIKKASPFRVTIVNELANDMLDYIPNRRAYPEGSYEPTTARCAAGCGELLVDAATRLLVDVYRDTHAR